MLESLFDEVAGSALKKIQYSQKKACVGDLKLQV